LGIREAARAHESTRPIGRAQPLDPDDACRARRVDELAAADRDAHMRRARTHGRKEHEIAGSNGAGLDRGSHLELASYIARQGHSITREHILSEAAAVEADWVGAAV